MAGARKCNVPALSSLPLLPTAFHLALAAMVNSKYCINAQYLGGRAAAKTFALVEDSVASAAQTALEDALLFLICVKTRARRAD